MTSKALQNVVKLNEIVSVKDFGAKGDGASDDAAAINAALTAAGVVKAAVYIPATSSYYRVTDELLVPDGVTVYGDGYGSYVQNVTAAKNLFVAGNNTTVRTLRMKMATGNNLNLQKQNAVFVGNKTNVSVLDNWIELAGPASCGVQIYQGRNITIRGNIIYNGTWHAAGPSASASDILAYSTGSSGRYIIEGNYCLSNNSQGIAVDMLGYDQDIIINANVCVTLDPTTCVEGGTWSEAANGGNRRHAIMVGYNNSAVNGPRAIVTNNVCRNTRWTGIYQQGQPAGPVLIANNFCSRNGYEAANSLSGGIYIAAGSPFTLVDANVIDECQSLDAGTGGITVNIPTVTAGPTISNNLIKDSAGAGIRIVNQSAGVSLIGNTLSGNVGSDIGVISSTDNVDTGGFYIAANVIRRTSGNNVSAISLDQQSGRRITTICNNVVYGHDATNAVETNAGIRVLQNAYVRIHDNTVEKFNVAVTFASYWTAATRHFDAVITRNTFRNCTYGVGAGATANTAVLPITENIFDNVTTPISSAGAATNASGFSVGYIARKDNTRLVVLDLNAAPTVGTWAIGDRAEYTIPTAGGFIGAVCTTAGNPGTWKTFGAITA
jgi:parallel beta-helix repeat protein